ncbi:DUF2505 domain-containing protein [Isoptericola sp. AK164]|uniref:DUF2505 domain-containing protein n=1 Tax=Isoptericola sp. AK164 TaxID=3024246 RepID=UPI0024188328|nr:DUF2505 domain-containing protein [Isoptericola sp. AK164]
MHLTVELTYPADTASVAAMLSDPEFLRWRARDPGAAAATVVDQSGSPHAGFTVALRRTLPTDVIPVHLRHVVGDQLEIRQAEAWEPPTEGRYTGTVVVEITGAPVRLTGTLLLAPTDDGGTRQVVDGVVHASVPLFAAAVEDAAAAAVRRALEAEAQAGRDWLARS